MKLTITNVPVHMQDLDFNMGVGDYLIIQAHDSDGDLVTEARVTKRGGGWVRVQKLTIGKARSRARSHWALMANRGQRITGLEIGDSVAIETRRADDDGCGCRFGFELQKDYDGIVFPWMCSADPIVLAAA